MPTVEEMFAQILKQTTDTAAKVDELSSDINAVNQRVAQLELMRTEGLPPDASPIYPPASGLNAMGLVSPMLDDPSVAQSVSRQRADAAMSRLIATPDGEEIPEDYSGHVVVVGNRSGTPRGQM